MLGAVIFGLLHMLIAGPRLNKKDWQALIGHFHWLVLLNRHVFACFDVIYDVVASLGEDHLVI